VFGGTLNLAQLNSRLVAHGVGKSTLCCQVAMHSTKMTLEELGAKGKGLLNSRSQTIT